MMDRLLEICALDGTSGDEGAVRDYIKSRIHADKVITDNLGNLLAFKKGRKTPKNRIMFAAHMDEVGFMATDITSDGFLRFGAVGGIDPRVVLGRAVRFGNGTRGVIGTKAVHQQSADERKRLRILTRFLSTSARKTRRKQESACQGETARCSIRTASDLEAVS